MEVLTQVQKETLLIQALADATTAIAHMTGLQPELVEGIQAEYIPAIGVIRELSGNEQAIIRHQEMVIENLRAELERTEHKLKDAQAELEQHKYWVESVTQHQQAVNDNLKVKLRNAEAESRARGEVIEAMGKSNKAMRDAITRIYLHIFPLAEGSDWVGREELIAGVIIEMLKK